MSTIKSLPSDSTFNSVMEAKSSSLGFNHQKYGQEHSAKKTAQEILQKTLTQKNNSQKKPKKPIEELAIPVVLNISAQAQNVYVGTKMAFLSSGIVAEVKSHSANQTADELTNGQKVQEDNMPLGNIPTHVAAVSMAPAFNTKTMEQKMVRFLSNHSMSDHQSQWKGITLVKSAELTEMTTLKSSQHDSALNLSSEAITQTQSAVGPYEDVQANKSTREINTGKPELASNEPLEMQSFSDIQNLNIEKSELVQSDEMDITKNILAQMKSESVVRPTVSSQTQSPQASLKQTAELAASMIERETLSVSPERTLNYTFSQWQNTPSVSFSLAHASHENMVASTYSHEVQQALEDNRHLFNGEQKMVIKREEREGQQRQQQQQNKQEDEEF
ncbi:TPA: type III secretion protein [Providencia alcalifaciens]